MTEKTIGLFYKQNNNVFKEKIDKLKIIIKKIDNIFQLKKNSNTINKELEEKYEKMSEDINNNISIEDLEVIKIYLEKKLNDIKKNNIYDYKKIEIYSKRLGSVKSILGEFEDAQINFDEARKNGRYYDIQKEFSKEELENLLKDPNTTSEDIEKLTESLNEGLGTDEYGKKINFDDNFIEKQKNNIKELENKLESVNSEKFYPPDMEDGIDIERDYLSLANISYLKSQICNEEEKKQLLANEKYYRKVAFFQKKEKSYNHELEFFSDKKNLENFIYDNVLNISQLQEKFYYLLELDRDDRLLCKEIYENIKILEKDIEDNLDNNKNEKLAKINLFKLNFLKNMNPPENKKEENIKNQNECMDKAYGYYKQNAKENSVELNIINLSILNNELEYQLQKLQNKDNSDSRFSIFENLRDRLKKYDKKIINTSKFKTPKEITDFFVEIKEKIDNNLKKTKKQMADIFDPTKSKAKEIYEALILKGSENPEALYECGRYMRLIDFEEAKIIECFEAAAKKGSNEAKMELFKYYFKEYKKKDKSNNKIEEKLENLLNKLPEKYYETVAEIYAENEEYKKAREYYFKSTLVARKNLDLFKERSLNTKIGDCYAKIANKENNNYQKINNYKRAIFYYNRSDDFFKGTMVFKTEWKILKVLKDANEIDYYELEMENGEKVKKNNKLKHEYEICIKKLDLVINENFDINKNNFLNEKEYIENILIVLVNEYKNKDYKKYENYLKKLTEISKNKNYIYDLGYLYKYGSDEYGQNIEFALEYLQKAADLGDTKALFELGDIYINGAEGIEKDENKAQEYFKKVVDSMDADSIRKLGNIYKKNKDINKAIEYYQKAADLGNVESIYFLGNIYELGRNGEKNIDKATKYYQKAADLGHMDSKIKLVKIYKTEKKEEKLIKVLESFNDKKNEFINNKIFSHIMLGDIYALKDTPDNLKKAKEYYDKAFEQMKFNEEKISEQNKKEINIKHEILNFNEKTTDENIKNNVKDIFEYVKENYSDFKEKEEKLNEFVKIINLKIVENNKKLIINNILEANNEFSADEVVIENIR